MNSHIIPTVFAYSKNSFIDRFEKLIKISKDIQIDIMDGKFVKEASIDIKDIPDLKKYNNNFEAHLMMENPKNYIERLKKKGFKKIIFHYEALKHNNEIEKTIEKIREAKMKVFIALNPETSISRILFFLHKIDGVLFLGVHPGKEHQSFIPETYEKIKKLREFNNKIEIQVDGGVNIEVAKKLKEIGVDKVNSGSFVADAKNPSDIIKRLNVIFEK
ncbi:MAG: ribulose-phosphate 3-epimerase [archaeon]|nr:ribulose-phosphate 3-epimerase [archaeon]